MHKIKEIRSFSESGFTLIEMLVVIALIVVLSAITVSQLYTAPRETGGAERVLAESKRKIVERQETARRLNGDDRRTHLESFVADPLPIDFGDLGSTGSLSVNGQDDNADCVDDLTGAALTCLSVTANRGFWVLAPNNDPLTLPSDWRVAMTSADLGGVPLIGSGQRGRGILTTVLGFDKDGNALAWEPGATAWAAYPSGAVKSDLPAADNTPFWSVYLIKEAGDAQARMSRTSVIKAAVALAVTPAGRIESFRWDGDEWIGDQNRTLR